MLDVARHDTPSVSLKHVNKIFPNGAHALSDISLEVASKEFVSFLGPSGCGKSTIFRLIAGLDVPSSGTIHVFGTEPGLRAGKMALRRPRNEIASTLTNNVAYVFQDPTLLPWLNVAQNVALPLSLEGKPRSIIRQEVQRVLELVGLADRSSYLPRQLSGGMRMRVSIARALVARPRLLLMDEPFAALDEITRQALQDEVLSIFQGEEEMSVLFVTHNVFEAAYLSSRVVVLGAKPGHILADIIGHPSELIRDPAFRTQSKFSDLVSTVGQALSLSATGHSRHTPTLVGATR